MSSIYGDEWCVIDEAARIFCIKISNDLDLKPKLTACLQVEKNKILHINHACLASQFVCNPVYDLFFLLIR